MKINLVKSLEDISEDADVGDETGNMMYEQEESNWVLRQDESQLVDAEMTQSVLEEIDAAKTPEEAICIAKEHLLNRIGYKPQVSVESFTVTDANFKDKFELTASVAQESIFARIGDAIKFSVSSDSKIADQILKATKGIETSGSNEKTLKSPGWGWIFDESGKTELSAEDVISTVKKYKAIAAGSSFNGLTDKVADLLDKISSETNRNWFVANASSAAEIKKLSDLAAKVQQDIAKVINVGLKGGDKKSVTLVALTPEQASKLSKEVLEILKHENLEKIAKTLTEEIKSGENMYNIVSSFRYQKEKAEDVQDAKKSIDAFRAVLQELKDFLAYKSKVCYSSLQYIKASTK